MELSYQKNLKYLILAIVGCMLICFAYLIHILDPLEMILNSVVSLAEGTLLFELWSKPPFEVLAKVYLFNVTNHEEFLKGTAKMHMEEIGPYVFQEILTNSKGHFNENGTLTFYPRREMIPRPELSAGDVNKDILITPNLILLGMTAVVHDYNAFVNMAVASITNYLGSKQFLNITVEQYLWGYDDPLIRLASTFIPTWIDFTKFGIMDRILALDGNNTVTVTLNSKNGSNNTDEILPYSIQMFNGSPGLKHWGYTQTDANETHESNGRCNTIEGTYDGGLFPRHLKENVTLRLYRRAFCRPVEVNYENTGKSADGYKIYNYRIAKTFLSRKENYPDNECYCRKDKCLPNGVGSLAPCYYSIPITISQPHYLNADPALLDQIDGLKPDPEKHDTVLQLIPELGFPASANLRVQINLDVPDTRYNAKTKKFNNMSIPLMWIELGIYEIPQSLKFYITAALNVLPIVQKVLMWLLGILGISMIGVSALIIFYFPPEHRLEDPFGNRIGYSPILVLPIPQQFKPDLRISK